jgi:hypothetical protein
MPEAHVFRHNPLFRRKPQWNFAAVRISHVPKINPAALTPA